MDKIQITLTTPVVSQEDETPTPTKFLKQCEDIGLFNDLQRVNPFDETFKKAIDTQYSLLKYPLTVPNPDETLNTPTPFQIVDIYSKTNGALDPDKKPLDLTDKPLELSEKSVDVTGKSSSPLKSRFVSGDILSDENSNISMKSSVSSSSVRSPINYSVDTDHDSLVISDNENRKFKISVKTDESSKLIPIKSKQINSTSESIKKFILNKKKNRINVENKSKKNEFVLNSESAHDILKRTSARVTDPLCGHSINPLLHALKTESEGFDSIVERLSALNSIKNFQSPPPKLLALGPSNGLDLTAISTAPEIEITPILSPGSEKLPISRKQEETAVPLVKKKPRELTKEEKRQQILERNRLAAKRSRERQKVHQNALELRLKEKEKECKQLKLEVRNLKMKLLAKEQDIDNLAHMKAQEMLSRALGNT